MLLSHATAQYMVTCWGVEAAVHTDVKLRSLAARVCARSENGRISSATQRSPIPIVKIADLSGGHFYQI